MTQQPGETSADPRDDFRAPAGAEELRRAMGEFATGVTVLASGRDGDWQAMTANAFTSVSLEPPLVLICLTESSQLTQTLLDSGSFTVSVLAGDQEPIARHFADPHRDRSVQFDTVPHEVSAITGAPLVIGALSWFECEVERVVPGGDHIVVIGQVLAATMPGDPGRVPLSYLRGGFATVS